MNGKDQIQDDDNEIDHAGRGDFLEEEKLGEDPPAEDVPEEIKDSEGLTEDLGALEKKEQRVPLSRFNEAVSREREAAALEREAREEAERRYADLEKALKEKEAAVDSKNEARLLELEKDFAKRLSDGDAEGAAAARSEIRKIERAQFQAESERVAERMRERAASVASETLEEDRLEAAIARLEAEHPAFNEKSERYDADLVALVAAKQRALVERGMKPSAALEQAGGEVAARFLNPASDEKPTGLAGQLGKDRKATAVERNLDIAGKQPPRLDVGLDSDKAGSQGKDAAKMSDEEFDALPEETRARLRGDFL